MSTIDNTFTFELSNESLMMHGIERFSILSSNMTHGHVNNKQWNRCATCIIINKKNKFKKKPQKLNLIFFKN